MPRSCIIQYHRKAPHIILIGPFRAPGNAGVLAGPSRRDALTPFPRQKPLWRPKTPVAETLSVRSAPEIATAPALWPLLPGTRGRDPRVSVSVCFDRGVGAYALCGSLALLGSLQRRISPVLLELNWHSRT